MKLIKILMICTVAMIGFGMVACKKEKYISRDTSGLKPPPPDTTAPPDPSLVVFDSADKSDGWQTVGSVSITSGGQKEGNGYIKNTIANGSDFMQFIKDVTKPVNTNLTATNGQFRFWFYISDPTIIKDGSIEITSSGESDKQESAWDVAPLAKNWKSGWNDVVLDFATSIPSGGSADYSGINHFRIFFSTTTKDHLDLITGIDYLRFQAKK